MFAGYLLGRTAVAEIVKRERLASHVVRTLQWVRMSVVREIRRAEDHYPIEYRQHFRLATAHVAVPQLQVAAIFFTPILVQVQKQIQASVQSELSMLVEI